MGNTLQPIENAWKVNPMKKYSLLLLLFYSVISCAGINVSPLVLRFNPADSYQDLKVSNTGTTIQYVKIVPNLVVLRKNRVKQIKIKDPKKMGLLITPSKLVLPPKQSKYVRVVLTKPAGKVERDYVIAVTPVTGRIIYPKIAGKNAKKSQLAMKVIIAYGVMTIVNPKVSHVHIVVKRNKRKITVKNSGNVGVVLRGAKQCSHPRKCVLLKRVNTKILYPTQRWSFTVPHPKPVSFQGTYLGRIAKRMKFTSN